MKKLDTVAALRNWRDTLPPGAKLGFVPTMGALHSGHLALIERARAECDHVAVSVFVNPTQFNDPGDLEHYPRPLEADLGLLRAAGVDAVFTPSADEIYADGYRFVLHDKRSSAILCGASRPGHFDGVLTVVLKLLHLTRPERAYFGEKDYQQLQLITEMCQSLFVPVTIVPCPTVRAADGLALSSRNALLTAEQRERAPLIHRSLSESANAGEARERLRAAGFRVDYVEEHWGRRFAAAFLGEVRLIDNVPI
jgi:pantoate--beta-alanine ligase